MKIKIGFIQRPFGIKGEVKIKPTTDNIETHYSVGDKLLLELNNQTYNLTIESVRMHQKSLLIKFEELIDRTAVEPLHDATIYVHREDLEKAKDNEYYFVDLVDCEVYDKDNHIGTVSEVLDMPAQAVLRIKTNNEDILIPFVKQFIEKVDIEDKTIHIKYMEGLY